MQNYMLPVNNSKLNTNVIIIILLRTGYMFVDNSLRSNTAVWWIYIISLNSFGYLNYKHKSVLDVNSV